MTDRYLTMTVGQLRNCLADIDDDSRIVVLAKDREGNDFSPLDEWDLCQYHAHNTWSGEISDGERFEDGEDGDSDAVVLWPVN